MKIGRIKFKLRKYVLEVNRQRARRNSNPFQPSVNALQLKVEKEKEIVVRHSNMINKNFKKEMFVEANEEIPPCRF